VRLIEVLLAAALFVFVGFTGFEALRGLGAGVTLLAQRGSARANLALAAAALRSDAASAVAVWKPASACGDAVTFMQRDAAGTSFTLYAQRGAALVRAAGPGPLDPCDPALATDALIPTLASFTVTPVAAAELPAHRDAIGGAADGGMLRAAGIANVAVDAHARDVDGTQVRTGNGVVEVVLDADPAQTVVDLVAGNRPTGYTSVLTYACAGRCAANGPFPELRGADVSACVQGIDFQNAPAYYVPATFAAKDLGGGATTLRVTSYWVTGAYTFAFTGADAPAARRTWTPAVWPPGGALVDDPYPVDYGASAIAQLTPARIAADLGAAATFGAELGACAALNADAYFHG
jgi:hypothetical protein